MKSSIPARVTIGLPVFNGESTLRECLENLETQSFEDFKVVIRDNASTDGTEVIAREFAEKDARFAYIRNAENNGPAQNFLDALNDADTDYFLWRADDDLAAPDFLKKMVAKLDANPAAVLAVGHVESHRPSRYRVKHFPYVAPWRGPRVVNIIRQLFGSHASWIYGVWRTNYIQNRYKAISTNYHDLWAHDHLVLLGPILDGTIVGNNTTRFVQQIGVRVDGEASAYRSKLKPSVEGYDTAINEKELAKSMFRSLCRQEVVSRGFSALEKLQLSLLIDFYADKRIGASGARIFRLRLGRLRAKIARGFL